MVSRIKPVHKKSLIEEVVEHASQPVREDYLPVASVKAVLRYVATVAPRDYQNILDKWGMRSEFVNSGDGQIPVGAMDDVWSLMVQFSKNDIFVGFEAARCFDFLDMGLLGVLFRSAETVQELLELSDKYLGKKILGSTVSFRKTKEGGELFWTQDSQQQLPSVISCFILGTVFIGYRTLADADSYIKEVHFPFSFERHPRQTCFQKYVDEYFSGASIFYNSEQAKIVFDAEFFLQKLRTYDPELRVLLEKKFKGNFSGLKALSPDEIFLAKVRALIRENLRNTELSSKWIAKQLSFSQRTLDRHLARLDTSYKNLREEIQRDFAEALLVQSHTVKKVASEVGFADVSSFVRAFKRWTQKTPGRFQRRRS
jgi:AraC-like DNA-binding protein